MCLRWNERKNKKVSLFSYIARLYEKWFFYDIAMIFDYSIMGYEDTFKANVGTSLVKSVRVSFCLQAFNQFTACSP
jgi:hypothetical protein